MENWSPNSRYESRGQPEAQLILDAIADPDHGVFLMYKTTFVRADIKGGERVVSALEASGLKIAAAFWSNKEDEDDWYLVVVSPEVAEKGATTVYKQV